MSAESSRVDAEKRRAEARTTLSPAARLLKSQSAFLDRTVWILGGLFLLLAILVDHGLVTWLDQWAVDHVMPALRPRSIPRSVGKSPFPIFHVRHGMNLPVSVAVYSVAWIASALPAFVVTSVGCLYLQRRGRSPIALRLGVAFVAVAVVELATKSLVERPALYGTDPRGARVKVAPFDTSFFSGHAARSVILAALLFVCARRLRWIPVVWLASVIVLLVVGAWHTPSDVAGAVLLVGALVVPALREDRRPGKPPSDDVVPARESGVACTSVSMFRDYVDERRSAAVQGLPRGWLVRALRHVTTHGIRESAKLHATKLFVPVARVRARRLVRNGPVRLHLGCGTNKLPDWVNIDIFGMDPDLHWDLRWRLPFPDGSATAVFLEHVIEHFTLADAIPLLDDSRRVLRPGGRIRIGVPDFGSYLLSYAGDGGFIERNRPGRPTPLLAVAEVAFAHGHRSVWDGPTLLRALEDSGFADAEIRTFGDSFIDDHLDSPIRESETIYAEAVKP